jgi:hypothetical protein
VHIPIMQFLPMTLFVTNDGVALSTPIWDAAPTITFSSRIHPLNPRTDAKINNKIISMLPRQNDSLVDIDLISFVNARSLDSWTREIWHNREDPPLQNVTATDEGF